MSTKMVHMCLCVRGALRNQSFYGFTKDDGTEASADEAFEFLCDQLAMGRRVIPLSGECDNFDYQTGCQGHETPDEPAEEAVTNG